MFVSRVAFRASVLSFSNESHVTRYRYRERMSRLVVRTPASWPGVMVAAAASARVLVASSSIGFFVACGVTEHGAHGIHIIKHSSPFVLYHVLLSKG